MIKPPRFWHKENTLAATALLPLGYIYNKIVSTRLKKSIPKKAAGPIICIGNVTLGGVGKTPFSIMLSKVLQEQGLAPHFLTRGYGGSEKGPLRVDTAIHTATLIGDEPQLLAIVAPTWVSADRLAGASNAFQAGADLIIMDDGFQNPSVQKDFSFLLIDVETGFGNGKVFPAGPLREKAEDARARAQAIVFVKQDATKAVPPALIKFAKDLPILSAWLEATPVAPQTKVVTFSGIGRPEKFHKTARDAGYEICESMCFADHHLFSEDDLIQLRALSHQHSAPLLTTTKDYARLTTSQRTGILTLPVTMKLDAPQRLITLLEPFIQNRKTASPK